MAGKITIQRIGSMLPTVCLLLFFVLSIGTIWLSAIGFPSSVLRYIESKAADEGIALRIGALRLYPARGLAVRAEDVKIFADASDAEPLAMFNSASAGINVSQLLLGKVRPSFFMLTEGRVQLPVTVPADKNLTINELNIAARFEQSEVVQLTAGFMRFQGIPIRIQGSCDLKLLEKELPKTESEAEGSVDIRNLIAAHQETINKIYQHIEAQQWTPQQLPSLNVRLAVRQELRVSVRSSVPTFNLAHFHFRDAVADFQYNNGVITIDSLSFHTVDPEAFAKLQGGYDLKQRHLSFSMESNAALVRMVRYMSEGPFKAYLSKFHHPNDSPPEVRMGGDVVFEEDYTLKSARVRGNITQKNLRVGSTAVDAVELSFFYDNGNFNIDKLELLFPDGSLQCVAAAQDGAGMAQLVADIPVQKALTLASELSEQEVSLPDGLTIGERVQLTAHAQLSAPAFKPGQAQWKDYVPMLHVLSAEVKTDRLIYQGYSVEQPHCLVQLNDIEQNESLALRSLGSASLRLKAERISLSLAEDAPLALEKPDVGASLTALTCGDNSEPREVKQLSASLQVDSASLAGGCPVSLSGIRIETNLQQLILNLFEEHDCLRARGAAAQVHWDQADVEDLHAGRVELLLTNEQLGAAPRTLVDLLLTAQLRIKADELVRGETHVGDAELAAELPEEGAGKFSLQFVSQSGETPCVLDATLSRRGKNELSITDIHGSFPRSALSLVPTAFGIEIKDMEIPEKVELQGACTLELDPFALQSAALRLEVPQLVRTPWRQQVFRGKRVPLALEADAIVYAAPGEKLNYRLALDVAHETGAFKGLVVGSTAGQIRVTGTNTIRPDVVDMLIDNEDAHSIIRDFRFSSNAQTEISDIDTKIDYSNGLKVDSFCRVDLRNTEYLISVLEDTPSGGERMRSDLGSNPYTLVNHGSCEVLVHVVDACRAKDGSLLPNQSVVTINNAVLDYNNAPWLSRQGWKTGVLQSRLEGRSIIIDIEHSFVELIDVRGTVYPAYSLGMFYPDLQHYMEDVIIPMPAQVHTESCVFPIYSDCTRPMSGVIRALAPGEAGFRFLGTTIPLNDFSGFIYITDDYVQLDRMNAKCWQGVLDAVVKIGISGKRTSFDGYVKAQCMNLKDIAAAYDSKQSPALCNGEIRFRSPSADLQDIKAYGRIDVVDGNLMTLSLFKPVSDLIADLPGYFLQLEKEVESSTGQPASKPGFFTRVFGGIFRGLGKITGKTTDEVGRIASNVPGMNHLIAYDLQEAHTNFDIINGFFITRDMKVMGYNLNVSLNLSINLDTLELRGNLWPRISSLPTILLAPFTFLSDFMVDIIIYGKVDDIKWRIALDRRKPNQPPSATASPSADSSKQKRTSH